MSTVVNEAVRPVDAQVDHCLPSSLLLSQRKLDVPHTATYNIKDPFLVNVPQGEQAGTHIYGSIGDPSREVWQPLHLRVLPSGKIIREDISIEPGTQGCAPGVKYHASTGDYTVYFQTSCFGPGAIVRQTSSDGKNFGNSRVLFTASDIGMQIIYDPKPLSDGLLQELGSEEAFLFTGARELNPAAGTYRLQVSADPEKEWPVVNGELYMAVNRKGSYEITKLLGHEQIPFQTQVGDSRYAYLWGPEAFVANRISPELVLVYHACTKPDGDNKNHRWGFRQRGVFEVGHDLYNLVPLGMLMDPSDGEYGAGSFSVEGNLIKVVAQERNGPTDNWHYISATLDRRKFIEYSHSVLEKTTVA